MTTLIVSILLLPLIIQPSVLIQLKNMVVQSICLIIQAQNNLFTLLGLLEKMLEDFSYNNVALSFTDSSNLLLLFLSLANIFLNFQHNFKTTDKEHVTI